MAACHGHIALSPRPPWVRHQSFNLNYMGSFFNDLQPSATIFVNFFVCLGFFFEHNYTPSGKKTVTGVLVKIASEVQSIGCK